MLEGRLQTLAKARATQQLSAEERETLEQAARELEIRLARERAIEALRERRPDARALAARGALSRGQGPRTRLKLLAAAAAPRLAGERLARRPRETTGGLLVAADDAPTPGAGPRP